MPSKEELFREAKDIHTEYAKCSSTSRRAELKRRYEEINCQLNKFTSNESAPNSSLMLNKNSVREPNIVSQQQNGTEVLEGFPKRENVPDSKHYNAEWKRYLLPLILVVASALTVGMWLWSQHKPIIDNLPTEENRSDKERAKTANELVSEGDSLWEEGFKGLNDKTLLNDVLAQRE